MRRVTLLLVLVASLVTLAWPSLSLAQGTPETSDDASVSDFKFGVVPVNDPATTDKGYFIFEVAEGDEAAGQVRLTNPGTEPVTIELAPVDAETAQTGGSSFAPSDVPPTGVGRWIDLEKSQVTLGPGQDTIVPFTVQPPSDTAPGQYLAGISAHIPASPGIAADVGENQAGASITMQTRYVIGVEVDVPGDWEPSLEISGVEALEQPSGTRLGIALRNNGDTFLKPAGNVTLKDATGNTLLTEPFELGTFVTGTDVTYPVAWPGVPQGGDYSVAVELTYADDKVARYGGTFSVGSNAPVARPELESQAQPAIAPAPVPAQLPVPLWVLYAVVGLLALIVILLGALFVRGSRSRW